MKLNININPKKLLRSKRNRSVSRSQSDPSSFGSGTTSSSEYTDLSNHCKSHAADKPNGATTPTSVLPTMLSNEISPEVLSEISADVYYELSQAFKLMDPDGNGKITRSELEALLSRVGSEPPSEEELMNMLSEVDRDGDGCISLEEFGAISSAFGPPSCDAELRVAFDFFDSDHDGKITADELFNAFSRMGGGRCTLEDCRRMISGVDKNGDGFVCFEDFAIMMEQQR